MVALSQFAFVCARLPARLPSTSAHGERHESRGARRAIKRVCLVATLSVFPVVVVGAAPASAGVIDCTLGYPGTLSSNPNDPTAVTVYPQVSARGPVDYANYVANGTVGYVNCVL